MLGAYCTERRPQRLIIIREKAERETAVRLSPGRLRACRVGRPFGGYGGGVAVRGGAVVGHDGPWTRSPGRVTSWDRAWLAVCVAFGGGRIPRVDVACWAVVACSWLVGEVLRVHGYYWLQVSVCGAVVFPVVAWLFFKPRRHNKSCRSSVQRRSVASRWLLLCWEEVDAARPPRVWGVYVGQDLAVLLRWWLGARRLWACGLRRSALWWRSCGSLLRLVVGCASSCGTMLIDDTCFGCVLLGSLPGYGCRMDIPGPTTQVGIRTDYLVGPWDYSTCATWHLLAWSARTTEG
jgi:hypothetical protein